MKTENRQLKTDNCQGNALWFILIAVILLGGLTMVLSRGSSSTGQSGDVEQARIKMSQIMRYAKSVEAGIQNLLLRGCSESEISFQNTTDVNYNNTSAPSDESCHVFQPEGAGLEFREFDDSSDLTSTTSNIGFTGGIRVEGIETDTDQSGNELLFISRVSQALCTQINNDFGITNTIADITVDNPDWDLYFVGTFATGSQAWPTDGGTALENQPTGCLIDDNGHHVFYQVLLAR